jgi:hypothetical protein
MPRPDTSPGAPRRALSRSREQARRYLDAVEAEMALAAARLGAPPGRQGVLERQGASERQAIQLH